MSQIYSILANLTVDWEQSPTNGAITKAELAIKSLLLSEALPATISPPKGQFIITEAIPIEAINKLFEV